VRDLERHSGILFHENDGDLWRELGVPVIDGVGAAVKLVEALVGLGLGTSKRGDLAYPIAKPYTGLLANMGRVHDQKERARGRLAPGVR
jgi:hypothetical protein